jgi:hypothetical protein
MKKFKEFIRSKQSKEKEEEIPLIPVPIHFKHSGIEDEEIPSIPEPIHFKHVDSTLEKKSLKKYIKEAVQRKSAPSITDWVQKNDNKHITKTTKNNLRTYKQISKHMSTGQKLTYDHQSAVHDYTEDSRSLNKHLLKNAGKPKVKIHKTTTQHLDDSISKNKIRSNMHTYSGVSFDPEKHINKQGKMKSPAYISSSHSKHVALYFSGADSSRKKKSIHHIMHFKLKKNNPAQHISHASNYEEEHETVIGRNTTLQHHGSKDYSHPDHPGKTIRVHQMSIVK